MIDIMAIGVHPDDVELSCSGTLVKHEKMGKTIGIVDLTMGELGTRGDTKTRNREALEASEILGAKFRENLEMEDGMFQYNEENIFKIIRSIRKHQPTIVLANAVKDRHPDHGRASKLVSDSCYYAGLKKIETGQREWRPLAVYHYIQDYHIDPDFVVDISPYIDIKMASIMAFKSQFFDPDSKEPDTPISSESFIQFLKAKMRTLGRPVGADYAEGFTVNRYLGVNSLFDLL